jgi:hypothetical protein
MIRIIPLLTLFLLPLIHQSVSAEDLTSKQEINLAAVTMPGAAVAETVAICNQNQISSAAPCRTPRLTLIRESGTIKLAQSCTGGRVWCGLGAGCCDVGKKCCCSSVYGKYCEDRNKPCLCPGG